METARRQTLEERLHDAEAAAAHVDVLHAAALRDSAAEMVHREEAAQRVSPRSSRRTPRS